MEQELQKTIPLAQRLAEFTAGQSIRAWQFMGSHPAQQGEKTGYAFRVWAPNAAALSVVGDFNDWTVGKHPLKISSDGIWECFIPDLKEFDTYKYAVEGKSGKVVLKADPYAFHAETRPDTGSKLYDMEGYVWGDQAWYDYRKKHRPDVAPLNIYEVHLGSWRRTGDGTYMTYRDFASWLVPYVKEMGFTHVEFMPLTEHPLDDSWGYQCTGYFAPTSRFGTPKEFLYLIDQLHQAGVGVILDWVPAHFPKDAFGLYEFDGQACYEYADSRKGEHADWGTRVFDYARHEVKSFLFSSALYWLEVCHIDGLRVDAVASMIYLNYGRKDGEWAPNFYGGQENLEAVDFLRELNTKLFAQQDDILMIAEESTAWPKVSHPVSEGGLGFNLKWNMGWMNDITHYMKLDPIYRQYHHKDITFSLMYAFSEHFILPLSHDEVVHMKGSFLNKIPASYDNQFAGVRAFYTYMMTHPGKKLTMMGSEFGQWNEWHFEHSLDWHLLENPENQKHKLFFQTINNFYLAHKQLWEQDFSWEGFQWLEANDNDANTVAFLRKDKKGNDLVVVCNFSTVDRTGYRVGVPFAGGYTCLFSSEQSEFGGHGVWDKVPLESHPSALHGQEQSIALTLAPMSASIYQCTRIDPKPIPAETAASATPGKKTAKKPKATKKKNTTPVDSSHDENERGVTV